MAKFAYQKDIVEVFNDCIDRLAGGESIEAILQDYPDHAEQLRSLLKTGLLVYQAQSSNSEVQSAQAQGRGRIEEAMTAMKKPVKRRPSYFMWMATAAAAAFAMGLGVMVGIGSGLGSAAPASVNRGLTGEDAAAAGGSNEVAQLMMTATQIISEATQMAQNGAELPATNTITTTPTVTTTATPTPMPTSTAIPTLVDALNLRITATAAAPVVAAPSEPLATSVASFEALPATPLPFITTSTADFFAMSATPIVGFADVQATATALAIMFYSTGTPVSVSAASGGGDTSTLPDTGGGGGGGETITGGVPASGIVELIATPAPTMAAPSDGERDETTTSAEEPATTTDREDDGILTGETTTVTLPTALPADFSQTQIQPLQAGEINDNADWDTYLTYRSNYLAQVGYGVLDIDVTGRQIIQVVDEQNRPILGATVQVLVGTQLVQETRTYANGMTLFFPNANPDFRRIDTFRVVVTKGSRTLETSLNIKRLDDRFVITLR